MDPDWPLKIDDWKTTFLLERPIFRCELLVLGRVTSRIDRFRPGFGQVRTATVAIMRWSRASRRTGGDDVQEQHVTRWWFCCFFTTGLQSHVVLIGQVKRYFAYESRHRVRHDRWFQKFFVFVIFTPNLGKDSHFDEHIFQMGWWKTTNQVSLEP